MSVIRQEEMTCPLCGKTFSATVVVSYQVNGSQRSLDGDPHEPLLYNMVHFCPHCGYVFTDAAEEPDDRTRELVMGEPYQKALQIENYPEIPRKLLLLGYLSGQKGDVSTASAQYLRAYWYFRDNGHPKTAEALDRAIEGIKRHIEAKADLNAAMVLVDLLRQKGDFDQALEAVNSLGQYLRGNENLLKTAAFEWKLIMAGDPSVHTFGEVAV